MAHMVLSCKQAEKEEENRETEIQRKRKHV